MVYDSLRRQFVLSVFDSRDTVYLSEADMIAGNCSKISFRFASPSIPWRNSNPAAAVYLPQSDTMVWTRETDLDTSEFYFYDMKVNASTVPDIPATTLSFGRYSNTSIAAGDFYREPSGTIWEIGKAYGPGHSFLYQVRQPNCFIGVPRS
jgi:hypothetical protein